MSDFIVFLASQLFNVIMWLDSIIIIGSLSLLKILIIILLFKIGLKFLKGGEKA